MEHPVHAKSIEYEWVGSVEFIMTSTVRLIQRTSLLQEHEVCVKENIFIGWIPGN